MDPFDLVGAKLIRGFRTKTALVLACVSFLGLGYLVRPGNRRPSVPQERAAPIIADEVRRREPGRVFETVLAAGLAARVSVAVLTTEPWTPPETPSLASDREPRPAMSSPTVGLGIIHADGQHILSHQEALPPGPGVAALLAEGRRVPLSVEAFDLETGLVWLAGEDLTEPAQLASPKAGELAVAVTSMEAGGAFVPVLFGSECNGECRLAMELARLPAGTPIFGLSGRAMAIAGDASDGVAYGAQEAVQRLQARVSSGRGLPASLGLTLQGMTPALQARLGPGVLVSDVTPESPGARAGVEPGDVLVRCEDDAPVALGPALAAIRQLVPGRPVKLGVRRGGEEREVEVTPEAVSPLTPPAGRGAVAAPGGVLLADVLSDEQRARLGSVSADARVLSIDGTPVRSPAGARRLLRRRAAPWLLRVIEGGRSYFVLAGEGAA